MERLGPGLAILLLFLVLGIGAATCSGQGTNGGAGGANGGAGALGAAGTCMSRGQDGGSGTMGNTPVQHRAVAVACTSNRPPGTCATAQLLSSSPPCKTDGDCKIGLNGRCQYNALASGGDAPECACTYDACLADADCHAGGPCVCDSTGAAGTDPTATAGNQCAFGDCRTDDDCGVGGFCSYSAPATAASFDIRPGYFCHTPRDACLDDPDCHGGGGASGKQACVYSAPGSPCLGEWICLAR